MPNSHLFIPAQPCGFPAPHLEHNPRAPRAKPVCGTSVPADTSHYLGAAGGTAAGYKVEAGSSTPGCRGMGWSKAMAAPETTPWGSGLEEMAFSVRVSLVWSGCKLSCKPLSRLVKTFRHPAFCTARGYHRWKGACFFRDAYSTDPTFLTAGKHPCSMAWSLLPTSLGRDQSDPKSPG